VSQPRAVVITEASSPVALATAARLAANGDLVLMGTRRIEICEPFAVQLRSKGAAVFAAHLDLADLRSVDRFVEAADYLIGPVDVLVGDAGVRDGLWVGAQHLTEQIIPPMIDRGYGDVVLMSPGLLGASTAIAERRLQAWVAGLDAEFVGTGVRASIIRSTGPVLPDDVGHLIATTIGAHLRVVDVIAPVPVASRSTPVQETT
jgi:NAD(P)-dependent dehydrogenase (short-subunit alcohol dehydrogenase family)